MSERVRVKERDGIERGGREGNRGEASDRRVRRFTSAFGVGITSFSAVRTRCTKSSALISLYCGH